MKNLVKGLLCVGAAVAAGCVIVKRVQEIKELNEEIKEVEEEVRVEETTEDDVKKETVKKAVMIAGGIFVVHMINKMHYQNEISKLWDAMEVNKILWVDRFYKDGEIDEVTKAKWIKECLSHINDKSLVDKFITVTEVK